MRILAALLLCAQVVFAANHDETTPLIDAALREDVAKAKALIKSGENPNGTNRYGVFPLSVACQNGNAALNIQSRTASNGTCVIWTYVKCAPLANTGQATSS